MLRRVLRDLFGTSSESTSRDVKSRCLRCGTGFEREQGVCSECGAAFVAPVDDESAGDR